MSLLDALLLEPPLVNLASSPREIWIALRADQNIGSGTINDPFDGGYRATTPVAVSTLTRNVLIATATTSAPHGLATDDLVEISGVTGAGEARWNGLFPITKINATQFTYTMLREPEAAATGSPQAQKVPYLFDQILSRAPQRCCIHIGPGVFETRGSAVGVKSGQRLVGSGTAITTLKLVGASTTDRSYAVLGSALRAVDGFEACDFTVDCNLQGQPNPQVNCGGFDFYPILTPLDIDKHIRIRRVRAVNFGSQAAPFPNYIENFVIAAFESPLDVVFEDCIAEHPGPNIWHNSTIFHIGGTRFADGTSAYHQGCALRRNFVDSQHVYGLAAAVDAQFSSFDDPIVTLRTKTPHGLSYPGNVSVQGLSINEFNGVFPIKPNISSHELAYCPYAWPDNPTVGPDAFVGAPVSAHMIRVQNITREQGTEFKITTIGPHNRTVNNSVNVGNVNAVVFRDGQEVTLGPTHLENHFNGSFPVAHVYSKTELTYMVSSVPTGFLRCSGDMVIGQGHAALHADMGTGAVVEGNRIFHCDTAGPWHDTGTTRDLVARYNYYYDVSVGPRQHGGGFLPTRNCSLTHIGATAICNTGATHDLVVGQGVQISGAKVGGIISDRYNGIFTITTVGSNSFTYLMQSDPGADADVGTIPPTTFQGANQVNHWVIENNVISLLPLGYWSSGTAIALFFPDPGLLDPLPCVNRQVIVRDNVISSYLGVYQNAINVWSAENLIVENNVADVGWAHPVSFKKAGYTKFFNNQNSSGKPLFGHDQVTRMDQSELARTIEDAIFLSL